MSSPRTPRGRQIPLTPTASASHKRGLASAFASSSSSAPPPHPCVSPADRIEEEPAVSSSPHHHYQPTPDYRGFLQPTQLTVKSSSEPEVDLHPRSLPLKCPPTPVRQPPTPRRLEGVTPSVVATRRALDEELSAKKLLFLSPYYPRRSLHNRIREGQAQKRVRPSSSLLGASDMSEDEDIQLAAASVVYESSSDTSDDDLPSDRIPTFDFVRKLGEGNFGDVWLVHCRENDRRYAVKKFKRLMQSTQERQRCLREVDMWNKVSHCPRIVPLICAWQDDRHIYIQMKFCEGGTLDRYKHGAFMDEPELWTTFRDATIALQAIHQVGHVHNDVKPRNMYLSNGHLYLGDFGLMRPSLDDDVEEGDSTYLAPEVLTQRSTTPKSDVFSLGISFLELAGHVNLPQSGPLWHELRRLSQPLDCLRRVPEMERVVRWCMQPSPDVRPTCEDLLLLPVVASAHKTVPKHMMQVNFDAANRPASAVFLDTEYGSTPRSSSLGGRSSGSPFVPLPPPPELGSVAQSFAQRNLVSEFAMAETYNDDVLATMQQAFSTMSRDTSPRTSRTQTPVQLASRAHTPVTFIASPKMTMKSLV